MNTMKKISIAVALPLVLLMSGCAIGGTNNPPPANNAGHVTTPAAPASLLKGFGDVITYENGVSIKVTAPVPYTPSVSAAGSVAGLQVVSFTVTVTNGTKAILDQSGYPDATSGGQKATSITDIGNHVGDTPMGPLLAGQSITWTEAFGVADPANVTFSYSPGIQYKTAIFDSKH